ncbi:phosphoadenosine phosphosulfate reductase [Pyrolobus fumarii 1A]|uniref:Phosphoadenosine phosphosulfate reductase n=1 Tax=Pyrolobus fumarii (strain DSM 11204 / 1A) TaxID=694429 RepID=G0ECC5_PYRF1|nr:phosphoadenosine phosphosulfate reductase family protein [Pyrolobus fumarii]AEM39495.1 phosphoadenosine phosphosulfate reductase [Pyrolobus fumarii 1A]
MPSARLAKKWPIRGKLWWCPNCNVPLLGPECSKCGGRGIPVRLTEPGDAKPWFAGEETKLRRALVEEFGREAGQRLYSKIFEGRAFATNKIPHMDEMKEVILGGGHAGKFYYDPVERRWRFRLSKWTARIAVEEGIVATIRLKPGERLGPSFDIPAGHSMRENEQVVILDANGEPVGIGYVRRGRVMLQTRFGGEREPLNTDTRATIEDVLKANEYELYVRSSKAHAFIHVMYEKVGKPLVVSYSGGKDSLVALHLTLSTGLEPKLLFNNTGIELPETIEAVREAAERWGLELVEASAGDRFWRAVRYFGPPGRDYRWCCKICKLAPLSRTARKVWPDGALNVVGQRGFESFDRARSPRVWRNRWVPQLLAISPIQEWTQMHIWLYIAKHKLPYNKLYDKGFDRIGCFMCPASTMAELSIVEETHPELWKRWAEILEEWRRRLGMPEKWVTLGLWRWNAPATQKERLARKGGVDLSTYEWRPKLERWATPRPIRVEHRDDMVLIELDSPLRRDALVEQASILGATRVEKRDDTVVLEKSDAWRISFDGRRFVAESLGMRGEKLHEEAYDALKLAYRGTFCAGCAACEATCPTGAISVSSGYPVTNPEKCVSCRICIDTCPLAEVYFEHIVLPLVRNDPTPWRRPTKRKIEDTIATAKKLMGIEEPSKEVKPVDTFWFPGEPEEEE